MSERFLCTADQPWHPGIKGPVTHDAAHEPDVEVERDDVMLRTHAAVTMLNSGRFNERTKLIAFLSLQHPELGPDKIVDLANQAQGSIRKHGQP